MNVDKIKKIVEFVLEHETTHVEGITRELADYLSIKKLPKTPIIKISKLIRKLTKYCEVEQSGYNIRVKISGNDPAIMDEIRSRNDLNETIQDLNKKISELERENEKLQNDNERLKKITVSLNEQIKSIGKQNSYLKSKIELQDKTKTCLNCENCYSHCQIVDDGEKCSIKHGQFYCSLFKAK